MTLSRSNQSRGKPQFFDRDDTFAHESGTRSTMASTMAAAISYEINLDDVGDVVAHLIGCRFDQRDVNECADEAIKIAKAMRPRSAAQ
jgi:hypothetical protein